MPAVGITLPKPIPPVVETALSEDGNYVTTTMTFTRFETKAQLESLRDRLQADLDACKAKLDKFPKEPIGG